MRKLVRGRLLANERLRLAHGFGPARQDLAGDALDGLVEVVRHLVDEPDAKRRLGVEPLAREEVASRLRADLGEDERRDDGRNDPELHLGEPEHRVARGHRDVRARHKPGASAECVPLHAEHERRGAAVDRAHHAREPAGVLDVLVVGEVDGGALPLDVRAGAERLAVAGEHDDARIANVVEGLGELADELGVERIAPLGAGESPAAPAPAAPREARSPESIRFTRAERRPRCGRDPLRDGGAKLDEDGFPPLVEFFADNGLDGVFALGTTGEGLLLTLEERRRAADLFVEACAGRLTVVVHCGAQTTADSVALAEHAAGAGVDAIAAVAPPYYPFDEQELTRHFAAVAAACAPTPFFLYEIAARSGYAIPLTVVERLRDEVSNLAGLKVSDTPFDRVEPYLVEGSTSSSSEPLAAKALARGAAGVVSGLATAFPEVVASLVAEPTGRGCRARRPPAGLPPAVPIHRRLEGGSRTRHPGSCGRAGAASHADRGRARRARRPGGEMARIVVIGAGAIGASVAYHLAKLGADDVVLVDRGEIACGSTAKAMGGVRQRFSTAAEVILARDGIRFFEELGPPYFHQVGYLFLATSEEGLRVLEERRELQAGLGVPVESVDPRQIASMAPGVRVDDVHGGVFCAEDGVADPPSVTRELVRQAVGRGGAREHTSGEDVDADVRVVAAGPTRPTSARRSAWSCPCVRSVAS